MSRLFPSQRIAKKHKLEQSGDGTLLTGGVTVPAKNYGVVYMLWVDLDVLSETDLENLPKVMSITITIGSMTWQQAVHPFIAHVDAQTVVVEHRTVDLGPWFFPFGDDGLYSGVLGDDIVITVGSAGTGVKSRVNYLYSGD